MLAFAAVAVDLSALFATRRHAQTVVDLGALAGAQFAGVAAPALVTGTGGRPGDVVAGAVIAAIQRGRVAAGRAGAVAVVVLVASVALADRRARQICAGAGVPAVPAQLRLCDVGPRGG